MEKPSQPNPEIKYRKLFENPQEQVITLSHLFDAINESGLNQNLEHILQKEEPVHVLLEGSAFPRNIDIIKKLLEDRENEADQTTLIDISPSAIDAHSKHINDGDIRVDIVQASMNEVPLKNKSVDVLINDCAINFNSSTEENEATLKEIARVLKDKDSLAFVTVVVDHRYDANEYGEDQELAPKNELNNPGAFSSFNTNDDGSVELIPGTERKAWSVPYYEELFKAADFKFTKFDQETGRGFFPEESGISYRRYILEKL
jgi:hypothetical protein